MATMIGLVVSGGQTGVDRAGWRAAKSAGISTAGWMPRGFLAEDGEHPEFAGIYGATEHESREYPPRTHANAAMADVTLWFGKANSRGYGCTVAGCRKAGKPLIVVAHPKRPDPESLARDLAAKGYRSVNIAGNRESSSPGIGARVEAYLFELFMELRQLEQDQRFA